MAIDRESQVLADAVNAGITSPRELANFMAQVTHESNGLNRLEESFRYTRNISQIPVQSAWREGTEALESARVAALSGRPERLAELMYGGRNGNDEPGDGFRYHGRGYIQLTGKDNYRAAGDALELDLVRHPDLAAKPENASRIAVWYWENRVPENAREDVRAATRAVNGKYNGLEDREQRFGVWEHKLTPEVMKRLTHQLASPDRVPELPSFREGMKDNEQIRILQADLNRVGAHDGHGRELHTDGNFGKSTRSAVEGFQRDHQLPVDGVAGSQTLKAIADERHRIEAGQALPQQPRLDQPTHPDHALFLQARDAVHRLDAQHLRAPDLQSENLAASSTVSARQQGLTRIDHIVLGDNASKAYAVQGSLNSPHKMVAEMSTEQAVNTSVAMSSQQWRDAIRQQQATVENQPNLARAAATPAHTA